MTNDFFEYFLKNYIEAKCRCDFKGGNEPTLITRKNTLPYFISNQNSKLSSLALYLCKDEKIANLYFIASIISKILEKELDLFVGMFIISKFSFQEQFDGLLLYLSFN